LGESIVAQNMPAKPKKKRKKHENKYVEPRVLPNRSTRSTKSYSDALNEKDVEEKPPRKRRCTTDIRVPTLRPRIERTRVNDEMCSISYDSMPDWFRAKYTLQTSSNASGYLYVHRSGKGWQVQSFVTFENGHRQLVHHGIFSDVKTAALAQSVASRDMRVARTSNGGHHLIESVFAAAKRHEEEEDDSQEENSETDDKDDKDFLLDQ
jgi:hypothetical protein